MRRNYVNSSELPFHVWERARDAAVQSSVGLAEVAVDQSAATAPRLHLVDCHIGGISRRRL